MSFLPCPFSCSFSFQSIDHDQQPQSHSVSDDSFNSSSFSSRSSLPSSISSLITPSTTAHHRCVSTFKPNSSHILSLTLTLTGDHLFSGSSDCTIHLWPRYPTSTNTTTTTTTTISIPCTSAVKSLLILKDHLLVSAHQDHKIRIWKINEHGKTAVHKIKSVTTLPNLNDRLTKIFFAKNYVKVRRHKKCTWVHHVDAVSSLALSTDESLIYSASWDRTFKVWRSSDFKCMESVWNAHDDAINTIVSSHEGFVYTGSADKKIKVWRRNKVDRKHSLVDTLQEHKSAVNALAYDDHGSVLYSGACSGVVIVWEKNSGEGGGSNMVVEGALLGHKKAVLCVKVAAGELVCSGSADKTVRIWRRGGGKSYSCLSVLEGHSGAVKCLAMDVERCDDGGGSSYMVYSGSLDCDIKVWRVWIPSSLDGKS